MHSGHPKPPHPFHQTLLPVVSINGPQFGLHRFGGVEMVLIVLMVELTRQANRRPRVDESGHHHCGSNHPIRFLTTNHRCRTNRLDCSIFDHDHTISDHGLRDRVNLFTKHEDGLCRRDAADDENKQRRQGSKDLHWAHPSHSFLVQHI